MTTDTGPRRRRAGRTDRTAADVGGSTAPVTAAVYTNDGVRLDACHDPGPSNQLAIVLAHGFTGSWRRPAVRLIATTLAAHAGVLSFDFRGHGRSGGRSTVGDREVLDLAAVMAWARELGYARVATLGFSMGASVVIRQAGLRGEAKPGAGGGAEEPAAVAAVSGPARWYYRGTVAMRRTHWIIERRVGRLVSRLVLGTRISSDGWNPVPAAPYEVVDRIAPVPLLIVHGDADPYFPVEHAHQLYDAAKEPKELWIERGFGHAETATSPQLLHRIADWITTRTAA